MCYSYCNMFLFILLNLTSLCSLCLRRVSKLTLMFWCLAFS